MSTPRNFFQTAWVVDDLELAVHQWAKAASVGPFFVMRHVAFDTLSYRGKPTEIDTSIALAQVGQQQIELIQQHNDGPSVYRDSVPAGSSAMHHIGGYTEDLDADFERYRAAGIELACQGQSSGVRFAYFDTRDSIGCMTELMERRPVGEELFAMIAAAGASWDGRDPFRLLPEP